MFPASKPSFRFWLFEDGRCLEIGSETLPDFIHSCPWDWRDPVSGEEQIGLLQRNLYGTPPGPRVFALGFKKHCNDNGCLSSLVEPNDYHRVDGDDGEKVATFKPKKITPVPRPPPVDPNMDAMLNLEAARLSNDAQVVLQEEAARTNLA